MSTLNLKHEWTACRAIIRHAFYARWNQGDNWFNWLLLGATALVPLIALMSGGRPKLILSLGLGIPVGILTLIWWFMLLISLDQQTGAQGRLIPRIRGRSIAALALVWTVATLGLTTLYAIGGAPVALTAAIVGLVLMATALIKMMPVMIAPLVVLLNVPSVFKLPVTRMSENTLLLAAALLIVTMGALVTCSLWRGVRWPRHTAHAPPVASSVIGKGRVSWQYARKLRRDCESRRSTSLLTHCIGPGITTFAPPIALVACAALLLLMRFAPEAMANYRNELRLFIPVMMVALQILGAYTMLAAVYATTGEQAVARLTPGLPSSRLINQGLGRALLGNYARLWQSTTAVVLVAAWGSGASAGHLLQLLAACSLTLACAGMLLRDFSAPNDIRGWVRGLRLMLLAGAFVAMLCAAHGEVDLHFWGVVGLASVAWSAGFGVWRWNAMQRAPVAMPAGRR